MFLEEFYGLAYGTKCLIRVTRYDEVMFQCLFIEPVPRVCNENQNGGGGDNFISVNYYSLLGVLVLVDNWTRIFVHGSILLLCLCLGWACLSGDNRQPQYSAHLSKYVSGF